MTNKSREFYYNREFGKKIRRLLENNKIANEDVKQIKSIITRFRKLLDRYPNMEDIKGIEIKRIPRDQYIIEFPKITLYYGVHDVIIAFIITSDIIQPFQIQLRTRRHEQPNRGN